MIQTLRRKASIYSAFVAAVPKLFLAYSAWVWVEQFAQLLLMTIMVFFWQAVYTNSSTLGGLNVQQTINYILLAQVLAPVVQDRFIFSMGWLLREGLLAVELLRPVDFQLRFYIEGMARLMLDLLLKIPLALFAWLVFGLQLPTDPLVWGAFLLALLLGRTVIFFVSWLFACLAFYSTETWGLSVLYEGVVLFFSGALLPLTLLPGWLRQLSEALPFAQALFVPVSLLSGITPLSAAPQIWLVQLAWLLALAVTARLVFNRALRKVTVQGG